MSDEESKKRSRSLLDEIRLTRANADKGREPELLSSQLGTRHYSVSALLERITNAFLDEHAGGTDALTEADTKSKKLQLLLGTVDYVLAVESIRIDKSHKAEILRRAYSDLFSYGPLDKLFEDETITTITLEGADKAFVRRGHGELVALDPIFENESHLRDVLRRLLRNANADLLPDEPIIEAGLRIGERPVSVNVAAPPVTLQYTADIRVHPAKLPSLENMVASDFMTEQVATLIQAIAESPHGVIIVGDTESGKTTLLARLCHILPKKMQKGLVAIERAGELHLPDKAESLVVSWRTAENENPVSFAELVHLALKQTRTVIALDEVRADEAHAVAPLLADEVVPRQLWAFRGPADSKRLVSALGMLARRSDTTQGETLVRRLYERLPFIITVRRRKNMIQVQSVGEWQFSPAAEYPDFIELMTMGWEGIELTGKRPSRDLELPDGFWG
jgi:Flp pilus assembly CpaF family ATPase